MAISAGDFRTGLTLIVDGDPCQVLDFQHVKPGKGAAILKTKMRNLKTNAIQERNFNANTKFDQANISRKTAQYSYKDGSTFYFMDMETYEQLPVAEDVVGDSLKFVKENEMCKICSYKGSVFAVEPPLFVELEITDTEPGFKGDTATGATKPAVVETGATVSVPLFVDQHDKIKIDTRTGEYLSRV